jgi:hypothetical protein
MTFSDLLDDAARLAGDDSSQYRIGARTWLNLARSYIADSAQWKSAFRPEAQIVTAASTTSGLYALVQGSITYEHIFGDFLYDETNNTPIKGMSFTSLQAEDSDQSNTGSPDFWADAGIDSKGRRQIYLWPIPDGAYTIRFPAYIRLADITEGEETTDLDSFFGPVNEWSACFRAGLQYYHDLDDAEMDATITLGRFERAIKMRKKNNELSPHMKIRAGVVRTTHIRTGGRFDPSHYNNRGW